MNPEQENFFKAVIDRAKPDKQKELQSLLASTIETSDELTLESFRIFEAKIKSLIKDDTFEEIKNDINHFKRQSL